MAHTTTHISIFELENCSVATKNKNPETKIQNSKFKETQKIVGLIGYRQKKKKKKISGQKPKNT